MTYFGALSLLILIYCTFRSPMERVLADATSSVFALFYVGLTLIAMPMLREAVQWAIAGRFPVSAWCGPGISSRCTRDACLGKRKLAPTVSPNKTWEGTIGSVLGSVAVAGILLGLSNFWLQWNSVKLDFSDEAWWYWLLMAAVVNVAAQVGDLAESALKRSAGVKDSGTLLPGHGGVLDRIDALLLAAPVLWYAQVIRLRF